VRCGHRAAAHAVKPRGVARDCGGACRHIKTGAPALKSPRVTASRHRHGLGLLPRHRGSAGSTEICRMRCSSSRRRAAAQAHRSNGDSAPTSSLSALVPRGSAILAAMPHGEPHGPAVAASAAPTWVETEVRTDPNRRTPDTLCTPDGIGRSLPRTATPYVVRGFGVAESPHAVHSGAQGTLYARANCPSARPPSGCTPRIQSSATGTRQVRAIGAPRPA
jgi:hypothetical protein